MTNLSQLDLFDGGRIRQNYIRSIQRTVETYDIELRVALELVQNSIDAIRRNQRITQGTVAVDVDVPKRTIRVSEPPRV